MVAEMDGRTNDGLAIRNVQPDLPSVISLGIRLHPACRTPRLPWKEGCSLNSPGRTCCSSEGSRYCLAMQAAQATPEKPCDLPLLRLPVGSSHMTTLSL